MNTDAHDRRPVAWTQAERLLATVEHDLPEGRRQHHKERLMARIHDTSPSPARRPLLRRPAFVVPAALATVGALSAGALLLTGPDTGGTPADAGLTTAIGTVTSTDAAPFLTEISLAAAEASDEHPAPDQYVYTETVTAGIVPTYEDGEIEMRPHGPGTRRSWTSPDGEEAWYTDDSSPEGSFIDNTDVEVGILYPSDEFLRTLTTDPEELLALVYEATEGTGNSPDQQAFDQLGSLLVESRPSPELTSAVYRAVALIPDVQLVDSAVDAAGREGVAVTHLDERSGLRSEWIFDEDTDRFLGSRTVVAEDKGDEGYEVGMVLSTSAVTDSGIADEIGEIPAG